MVGTRPVAAALASALVLLALAVRADEAVPRDAAAPSVERFQLGNGLEVLLEPDESTPSVALVVHYHAGSLSDPEGLSGLAHLTEHMVFRGSRHLTGEQLLSLPLRWGVRSHNAETHLDGTVIHALVPAAQLPRMLWLEAERMAFTLEAMTKESLELERDIVANELGMRSGPTHLLSRHLARVSHPDGHAMHRYGGQRERDDLDAHDLRAVQWFFQGAYRPDNATLALVGNFDPALARKEIERAFGGIRNPSVPRLESTAEPVQFLGEGRARVASPRDTEELRMVWSLPEGTLDVEEPLTWLLLGILEGRLREQLVRAEPIAVDVGAYMRREPGGERLYVEVATTTKDALGRIESVVEAHLEALRTKPVEAVELRAQRVHVTGLVLFGAEHTLARARALVLERPRRGRPRRPAEVMAAMSTLDAADVQAGAQRLLPRARRLVVHVVSRKSARSGGEIEAVDGELFRGAGAHEKMPTPGAGP